MTQIRRRAWPRGVGPADLSFLSTICRNYGEILRSVTCAFRASRGLDSGEPRCGILEARSFHSPGNMKQPDHSPVVSQLVSGTSQESVSIAPLLSDRPAAASCSAEAFTQRLRRPRLELFRSTDFFDPERLRSTLRDSVSSIN